MTGSLRQVDVGQPLRIPAVDWNTLMDLARAYRAGEVTPTRGADFAKNPLVPCVRVLVSNGVSSTLPIYSIVKLGTSLISVSDKPGEAQRTPALTGQTPTAPTDAFGVLLEPLPAQPTGAAAKVVYAAVQGVTVAWVSVTDTSHGFAAPATGVTAALASGLTGPARILSAPSSTGTQLCLVLLLGGCCSSGPPPGEPTSLAATAGSGQASLDWTPPTGAPPAEAYHVYQSTVDNTMADAVLVGTVTAPTSDYTVTGLTNGTVYYFAITALSAGGAESGYSNVDDVTPAPPATEYTTSGDHTYTPSTTGNYLVECYAGGAGGVTPFLAPSIGGGGGAYSSKTVALTGGVGKTAHVGAGGATGVNGEDSTFDATVVVAKGGSGGGTGGSAAAGTGDTKFSGGNGAATSGADGGGGGGGAGSTGNGGNASGLTGGTGGAGGGGAGGTVSPAGASGVGAPGTAPGGAGGGGGASGSAGVGGTGKIRITGPL